MDTAQWPQEIVVKPMEEILPRNTNTITTICSSKPSTHVERKIKPHQKDQALNCPRCNSTNTKFCYYNNYSLSQPRYFCKTCKRYWTEGGSLRSIPVGGGSRKSKKSSSTNSSSANTVLRELSKNIVAPVLDPPKIHNEGSQDLNLGFSCDFKTISELIQVPNNSFIPMPISDPNSVYSSQNFSLDYGGISGDYENNLQDVQESTTSGRLLFPFEDLNLKQVSNTSTDGAEVNRDQPTGESTGYWNAFLGENGGSW